MSEAPLRLAFAGSPPLAAGILKTLIDSAACRISYVYTRPDKPAGRGRALRTSAVKRLALEHGLAVKQPADAAALAADESLAAVDVMVVAAYGMRLPAVALARPQAGCINVHASLLPRWRGAAPIQRAIQHGDKQTGVSIMQMDEGIDTGAVLLQARCPIQADDTAASLEQRLTKLGGECLLEGLQLLRQGGLKPKAQDAAKACYAAKINKAEAEINWQTGAGEIERLVRAFNPAPIAFARIAGQTVRIWQATIAADSQPGGAPGAVIAYTPTGLDIACGDGVLRITRLQLPGKRPLAMRDFYHGQPRRFRP